jgi:PAS domain S-box-containing protein
MVQLFTFTALVQTVLITVFLGTKAHKKNIPSVLFFLLMVNYTLLIFKAYWNINMTLQLTKLYIPISYAAGPIYYFFVKFSFLPTKKQQSKKWLWWFAPVVLQLFIAAIYWVLVTFNSTYAKMVESLAITCFQWDFLYFSAFFIAAVVFLVRNNALTTMNLIYKKQLQGLKYFTFFIVLFIIDEVFTDDNEIFFSSLIACSFTSAVVYFLLSNSKLFSKKGKEGKELLKEALNEREKAVVISNSEGIVEYVNESFLTLVGYRHRDVIGRPLCFLRGELTTSESIATMQEKMDAHIDFEVDTINYRKNGEAYLCRSTMIPVFSNNILTHYIAYKEDIRTVSAATPQDEDVKLFEKIKTYFITEEPFKSPHLQVADIAEVMGVSTRRIGEVLKKCEDQSFTEFVNAYRIQAALKMLSNLEYQNLTIESIGQMCGFNSKSVFYTTFKKETGKTPKVFLEEALS